MTDRAKVLVVDDELGPRESLRMILKDRYDLATVNSGVAALEYLNLNPVDLVLLDIKMPGLNGIETLKRIKESRPEVEVVLITAYASVDTAREAVRYSAVDYLIKPFSRADVDAVVKKGLARRKERLESNYELKSLQEQMYAFTLVSSQVCSEEELISVLSTVGKEAARALGTDAYAIYSLSRDTEASAKPLCGEFSEELMEHVAKVVQEILATKTVSSTDSLITLSIGDNLDTATIKLMSQQGYKAMLVVPLLHTQKLQGALVFCRGEDQLPSQREKELAQAFAHQASVVLHTNQLYEELGNKAAELTQKVAQLSIVRDISAAVLSNLDLDAVLGSVIAGLEKLGYKEVNLVSLDEKEQELSAEGLETSSKTLPSEPLPKQTEYKQCEEHGQFKITAPIMVEKKTVYLLEVQTHIKPNEKEIELISMLSEQIAIAIKNSSLYKEVNKTKNYLESLIRNAGDAIITANLDDEIVSWNKAAERIFQYSAAEAIGKNMGTLLHISEYEENREMLLRYRQPKSFEAKGKRGDGTPVDIVIAISLIKDADGNIVGISTIIQDVSEQNRLRHQLVHSEKQRALGVVSSGVAHNFNNVLAGILGYAQLLQMRTSKTDESEYMHKALKNIVSAALEGAAIIKRMQKFSHTDGSEVFKQVDLNEVVETSLSLSEPKWKHEPEAKGIKIQVKKRLGDVPALQADASQLNEVIVNLIFNAVEAMPNGGELTIETGVSKKDNVYLSVTDNGEGMDGEVKERIFDPFFTTKGAKGVGLGMSVVYGILQSHKAQIDVDSVPGKGSEFIIEFPSLKKTKEQTRAKRVSRKRVPANILVIENEDSFRELFAEIGEIVGYQVSLASSGAEGLEQLQKSPQKFDVLFTDLGMPDMNGWQVAKEAKRIAPSLPVILCTGWNEEADRAEKEHPEVDFVITKPCEIDDLLDMVNKAMELKAAK